MIGPIELTVRGTDNVVAHACGKCRIVARTREEAERCCEPLTCDGCGAVIKSYCMPCAEARLAAQEAERFAKATKVAAAEYDGEYLFVEDFAGGDAGEGYFSDEGSLRDACASRDCEVPAYAWACVARRMSLDADDVVESALESQEAREDAVDGISPLAMFELAAFLIGWAEKHGPVSYHPDYSRAIVFEAVTK